MFWQRVSQTGTIATREHLICAMYCVNKELVFGILQWKHCLVIKSIYNYMNIKDGQIIL